jgi:NitT/TauT family transport system permease protein
MSAKVRPGARLLPALGRSARSALVPVTALALWWIASKDKPTGLIPPPPEVGGALWDVALGGLYDDAFSATLVSHVLASASRV